jgi:hypothetical protein
MTSTEQHNIDDALAGTFQVVRSQTQDGVTTYYLCKIVRERRIDDIAAFGNIYSVTITP